MSIPLNIHPELQSIKAHKLPANRWALGALQNLLSAVNAIHRRKFKQFITRIQIPGSDGYPVPTLIIRPEKLRSPAPALVYYHGGAFVMKPAPRHFENALRYASPIYGDVSQLAPAYVETPEFDLLHDQGNAYARALMDKGVAVDLNEIKGGVHGFDLLAANSSLAKDAMQRRIQFLRRVF